MKMIIGLGNPGKEYAHTRHNIGWDILEVLSKQHSGTFHDQAPFQASVAEMCVGEEKVLLARPLTFMNHSGEAVRALVDFYQCSIKDVLIVHDEMDYGLGKMALCAQGGSAGHHGVQSVQEKMKTNQIARLRVGIGRPIAPIARETYVLEPFSIEERSLVVEIGTKAAHVLEEWCREGMIIAMNRWNV